MKKSILIMTLFLVLFGCSKASNVGNGKESSNNSSDTESKSATTEFVSMGTSSSGGTFNTLGVAMCQLFNDNLSTQFSAEVTGGSSENCIRVGANEIQIAFAAASSVYEATNGVGAFDGKKVEGITAVANLYPAIMQFPVSKSSGIKNMDDIEGKKINIGQSGSGSESQAINLLKSYEISLDSFQPQHLSHANAVEALTNDKIDGYIISGSLGQSHQMTAMSSGKCYLASFGPQEKMDKLMKDYPYYEPYTIKSGTYPNQDYDVETVATGTLLIANENLDEELVYEFTKTLFENLESLAKNQKIAEEISLETATNTSGIKLHPGAERYYKEVGILK
ncbi:TAXI family TRAP transporter solute-binding subunit [Peptoniphilus catoniae]|uniref:TAXI family TRAP transporter solute-binding subunit n=1 Tax=Peptoniphilus catoniae TaxID=1660341 RepID=UPI0010FDB023|nr:TAXI family TRAP transporter solute-binding subunit [Peptoniphilus catoniae]